MKRNILLLLILTFAFSCSSDDEDNQENFPEKIHEGTVHLNTQIEVDDFGAENYTKINGGLYIESEFNSQKITDLSSLSSLKFISSRLWVAYNSELTSLQGLNTIETVGEKLYILGNSIENLNGLNSLTSIGNETYIGNNDNITNLNGLNNVNSFTSIHIYNNESLTTLNGLDNLNNIDNYLKVYGNENLSNFCSLQNALVNSTDNFVVDDIYDNLFNPSMEDIINGNCSQ